MTRTFRNLPGRCRLAVDQLLHALRSEPVCRIGDWGTGSVQILTLEHRILMSASPAAVVAADAIPAAGDAQVTDAAGMEEAVWSAEFGSFEQDAALPTDFDFAEETDAVRGVELVVIDPATEDYQQLVADLTTQTERVFEILILDPHSDGIAQITDAVSRLSDISAIHIVSHGEDGEILLGTSVLSRRTFDRYAAEILTWQNSLTSDADVLIYGCDLAASESGRELAAVLNSLTGADIAASDDDTGHAVFGADWQLEYTVGSIQTDIAFSEAVQNEWMHVLNVSVDATSTGTAAGGSSSVTVSHTTSGTNRLMLVGISFGRDDGETVSSVTWNGTSLTRVGFAEHTDSDRSRVEIWSLVAPQTGTHDVIVNFSGSSHEGATVGVMTFTDVDQVNPLGTLAAAQGQSTSSSVTVSSAVGETVFGIVAFDDTNNLNLVPTSGQDERWDLFRQTANGAGGIQTGAASVTNSWSSGSNTRWAAAGVSIRPSSVIFDVTGEFLVNQTTSDNQVTSAETRGSQQAVSADSNGNYVVVWSSNQATGADGTGYGVLARVFDAHGNPLTNEFQVNTATTGDQDSARVAFADDGTFVVTWTTEAAGSKDIRFRKFSADGTALTAELSANSTTTGAQWNSVIAMDRATGDFVLAWQGEGPGDASSIFFRRFSANGAAKDAADRIATPAGVGAEIDPAIAMLTGGKFVIAWERSDNDHIYFQRFAADGSKLGGETQIDNGLATSTGLAVAADASGGFTFVYREEVILPGVWRRGYNEDGSQNYTWAQISLGDASSASIAMAADGSYVVTWQKTSDGLDVFARKGNADGSFNGGTFQVNQTSTGAQSMASVAVSDTDNFVVVWSGSGTADADGVYARQFGSPAVTANDDDYSTTENTVLNISAAGVLSNDTQGPPPVAGNTLGYNAASDTNGDDVWDNGTGTSGFDWDFSGGGVTYTTTPTTTNSNISAAWVFDGTGGGFTDAFESIAGNPTDDPASFEIWFNPSDPIGQELIFETGGNGQGTSLSLNGTTLELLVTKGAATALATYDLTTEILANEFIHVTGVVDNASAVPDVYLYVNGTLVDSVMDVAGLTFWANFDASGLGSVNGTTGTSNTSSFQGEIAAFRLYESALTATEVLTNFQSVTQAEGSVLTATDLNTSGTVGAVTLNSDGSFTYTPQIGFSGVDTFRYTADNGGNSSTATVTITVIDTNDPPLADAGGPYSINEGTSLILDASGSSDPDTDPLTYKWDLDNDGDFDEAGEPSGVAPTVTWATLQSFGIADNGSFTIGLQVDDGQGGITTTTATLTVVNVAPAITSSATASVVENSTTVQTVTATDPVDSLTFSVTGGADQTLFSIQTTSGLLTFNAPPDFETPGDVGANNVYEVQVSVSDGDGGITTQTITVTVTNANDNTPVVDASQSFSVSEAAVNGTSLGTVTASDNDAGTTFSNWTITGGNTDGIFAINSSTGELTVLDNANLDFETTTSYTLSVSVSDGTHTSAAGTVSITVTPANDNVPVVDPSQSFSISEAAINGTSLGTVTASDNDAGTTFSNWTITDGNSDGIFAINSSTGELTVLNNANLDFETTTAYTLSVTVSDGTHTSTVETVNVTVTNANEDPVAVNDSYTVVEGGSISIGAISGVSANDTDPENNSLTAALLSGPAHATAFTLNPDGSFSYSHDGSETTSDTFTYEVSDGLGGTATATVTLTVTPGNDAPTTSGISDYNGAEDTAIPAFSVSTAFHDTDPGDVLHYSVSLPGGSTPLLQSLSVNANTGVVQISLAANQSGSVVIRATATDSGGLSVSSDFLVSISPVNDRPTVVSQTYAADDTGNLSVTAPGVLAGAADVEGQTLTAVLVAAPSHGTVTLSSTGQFTYTASAGFPGFDSFSFAASDGSLNSTAGTVTITATPTVGGTPPATGGSDSDSNTTTSDDGNNSDSAADSGDSTITYGGTSTETSGQNDDSSGDGYGSVRSSGSDDDSSPTSVPQQTEVTSIAIWSADDTEISATVDNRVASSSLSNVESTRAGRGELRQTDSILPDQSATTTAGLLYQQFSEHGTMWQSLDTLSDDVASDLNFENAVVGSVGVVSTGFAVGSLLWAVRGGVLLSGLLAQLPIWTLFDPLLVIDGVARDDESGDSIHDIVDKQQRAVNLKSASAGGPATEYSSDPDVADATPDAENGSLT
ncbi:MAG: DUF4347 domain-containing protein [Planctomycetaceae bacterium]